MPSFTYTDTAATQLKRKDTSGPVGLLHCREVVRRVCKQFHFVEPLKMGPLREGRARGMTDETLGALSQSLALGCLVPAHHFLSSLQEGHPRACMSNEALEALASLLVGNSPL